MTQRPAARSPPRARARARCPQQVVDALDLVVARRTAGVLPGDRRAAGVGAGTELAQLRPYEPGDDVRHIDPAATARTGEPHVRVHVPERTLTTWIVLDVSPSMAFGTANRLKSDVAEGVALVVARLAVRRAGRVALMTFGAGKRHVLPPRASRRGMTAIRVRAERRESPPTASHEPTALADALVHLRKIADPARARRARLRPARPARLDRSRSARCARATRSWRSSRATRARRALPAVGHLALVDPETGESSSRSTPRSPELRAGVRAHRGRRRAPTVARELRRLQVEHVVLSTQDDWLRELGRRLR